MTTFAFLENELLSLGALTISAPNSSRISLLRHFSHPIVFESRFEKVDD